MKIIKKTAKELIEAEYNPRKISPADFEQLKKSLEKFSVVEPIVINSHPKRKGIIIGGHQRFKAMKSLGYTEFPCVEVALNKKAEKELNIRLNKNSGEFDFDLLSEHFDSGDLLDFGFDEFELLKTPDEVNNSDEDSEWVGMPEFVAKESTLTLVIHFEDEKDRDLFFEKYPMDIIKKQSKAWSTTFPFGGRTDLKSVKFEKGGDSED